MKMLCNQCESVKNIDLGFDSRGLPFAKCSDCGKAIKKMSTTEVISFYQEKLAEKGIEPEAPEEATPERAIRNGMSPCKYCTENFFMKQGRLGTIYKPIGAKYCPICGRRLKSTDRNY
jgi:endogenous inhibitor of DNA gyrase (YacG/DUF329 family)